MVPYRLICIHFQPFIQKGGKVFSMVDIQGFLRQKQVLKLIPISPAAWWRGIQDGRYPKGHKLSPKVTVWKAADIQEVIDRLGAGPENGGGE